MVLPVFSSFNFDPVAVTIFSFPIRWYGLSYFCGWLFSTFYMRKLLSEQKLWTEGQNRINVLYLDQDHTFQAIFWMALGVLVGGRMGYVLFYGLEHYLSFPWQILSFWEGGMSFHGGFFGAVLSLFFFARIHKSSFWVLSDLVAASAPFGIFLGRLSNFVNGELWGKISWVPWSVIFPSGGSFPRHPSQLYEAILEGLVLFFVLRIFVYRGSALKKPGLITGIFVCGYSILRIFVEFFREPDVQLGYLLADWITMGMILSLPMFFIGLWCIRRSILMKRKDII
ncbi:prolipoprotein diacylglyceryl transferase [Liberibacter sp. Z1]|nr:prolipoprotein diacylglyceryl transferase [Candidatus Liberibacter sp.]MBA5724413.1 prolipoprotein diacylglyceryl transferase [Candidatus Liberibacter sp.]